MNPSVTTCQVCGILYDSMISPKCPHCGGVVKAEPLKSAAPLKPALTGTTSKKR